MPKTFQEALDSIIAMEVPLYNDPIKGSLREACESYSVELAISEILPHLTWLLDSAYVISFEKSEIVEEPHAFDGGIIINTIEHFTIEEKASIVGKFQYLMLFAGLVYQKLTNGKDFVLTLEEIADLVVNKQRDYGQGNILKSGTVGIVLRTHDKVERLKNLLNRGSNARNESIEDSWRDIVGYSFVALLCLFGWFALPIVDEVVVYEER